MQTYGISLDNIELEIKATREFLEKFCSDGCNTAIIETSETGKSLDVDSTFAETKYRKKKRLFDCQDEDGSDHDDIRR